MSGRFRISDGGFLEIRDRPIRPTKSRIAIIFAQSSGFGSPEPGGFRIARSSKANRYSIFGRALLFRTASYMIRALTIAIQQKKTCTDKISYWHGGYCREPPSTGRAKGVVISPWGIIQSTAEQSYTGALAFCADASGAGPHGAYLLGHHVRLRVNCGHAVPVHFHVPPEPELQYRTARAPVHAPSRG
eukprot:1112255-Prorocentrum_minimum.AAC.1